MTRALLAVAVASLSMTLVAATTQPPTPDGRLVVLGDSYASGEGNSTAQGACGRDPAHSWGGLAAAELALELELLACNGAVVQNVLLGAGEAPAQLDALDAPAALVALSIGGNDLGLLPAAVGCLAVEPLRATRDAGGGGTTTGWTDLVGAGPRHGDCAAAAAEVVTSLERLPAADRFVLDASGATGGLQDVVATVARRGVSVGGQLIVVGYPELWAPPSAWPARYGQRCHGLRAAEASLLADLGEQLDGTLATAVAAADAQLPERRVTYVPVLEAYRGAGGADHRLCGGGTPWVHGLTVAPDGLDGTQLLGLLGGSTESPDLGSIDGLRPMAALHPTAAGHAGTAQLLLDVLRAADG